MIGQYQTVTIKFIRDNHSEMNQKNILTSFSKEPANSTYTNTKKRLGESDTDPKMFNVELTSNQAQCKTEMVGNKISEKNVLQQVQQFQKKDKTDEKNNSKKDREVRTKIP